METNYKNVEEIEMKAKNGLAMLLVITLGCLLSVGLIIYSSILLGNGAAVLGTIGMVVGILAICILPIMYAGLKVINPNEALVLVLFGKYQGTLKRDGFYYVNPFCSSINPTVKAAEVSTTTISGTVSVSGGGSKKVSLKTSTLVNEKQKVNDELGNPIEIGVVVIWKVANATMAVFNVNNYMTYLSTQCDAVIRNVARCYPYDTSNQGDEWSLRGSSQEIAGVMNSELQKKVNDAGIEIVDVRINHLSYAPEIASAMLQRQQAAAIIDARQKIVEGAVSMVEMALNRLSENNVVALDEERKAAMVSNLLVVLCGNKDAQPIVNSGSIY
ncbi:MAG: SPFH domain-containing protein [Clostridiales bacterium]|nr:SPFH domain-containing protein [Clostridiales bacterium]